MALFSNRRRPVPAGPHPTELLPRRDDVPADRSRPAPPEDDQRPGPQAVREVYGPVLAVFEAGRRATVAPGRAPLPDDPRAVTDNLKGYGYFLDADDVGVCHLSAAAWTGPEEPSHTHALVVLVGFGPAVGPGEPGSAWIAGCRQDQADARATEIGTVLARYVGMLGYDASAHVAGAGDVDRHRLALEAGLVEARRGRLRHPFLRDGYGLAVVTTELALRPDRPLARRGPGRGALAQLAHRAGWRGTRPGWDRLSGRHRPYHLGRYPMERIRRVDDPTTLVVEEDVPRVPVRHNFFVRARAGDLGPRPRHEVARFITKAPHGRATNELLGRLVPLQRGETAPTTAPGTDDPVANAAAVKALVHFLGADMTGVCEIPTHAWYSHRADGSVIEPRHRNAIVFVLDQGYETMEGASGDDWISGAQSMRAYLRGSMIATTVAAHLRRLGYDAQAHTAADDEVLHIPLLLAAGIGELSRIGELVLNPFVGPRFKSAVVTTDLPLAADRPIDFGLQDFCSKCTKCARECPCGAIRFGGKVMFNGYEMWKPDVDRCARYRITNMRGSACGRCMKTCPFNTEGLISHRALLWTAIRLPSTRAALARLDDRFAKGSINPAKKWWIDVEMADDGTPIAPPKGANSRQLDLGRKPRDEAQFAVFPPDLAPPPGQTVSEPFPVDRAAGVAASLAAEAPDAARARTRARRPRP